MQQFAKQCHGILLQVASLCKRCNTDYTRHISHDFHDSAHGTHFTYCDKKKNLGIALSKSSVKICKK